MQLPVSTILIAFIVGAAAIPSPVRASRALVVARGIGAGSDKAATFVGRFMGKQLAGRSGFEVIDLEGTLQDPQYGRAHRAFQAARDLQKKGRSAYETLDLDAAVQHLTAAVAKYERYVAYVTEFGDVASALMVLGASHILRGEEKAATRRLMQAATMHPGVKPDPRIFNPRMRKVFANAVERLRSRPTGGVSITSSPSYAEAYLDGKFVGVTPVVLSGVTEGKHYLRLTKPGYRSWGRLLDVVAKDEVSRNVSMKAAKHGQDFEAWVDGVMGRIAKNQDLKPGDDTVDQMGALTNADLIFVAAVRLDGDQVAVELHHLDLNRRLHVQKTRHVFSYSSELQTYRKEVRALLAKHFKAAGDAGRPRDPPSVAAQTNDAAKLSAAGDEAVASSGAGGSGDGAEALSVAASDEVAKACRGEQCDDSAGVWALITGVGAGVLMTGGGVALWVMAKNDHTAYQQSVQISQRAKNLKKTGERKALVGDILVGAGAVAAVTGLVLYWIWAPDASGMGASASNSNANQRIPVGLAFVPTPGGAAATATFSF